MSKREVFLSSVHSNSGTVTVPQSTSNLTAEKINAFMQCLAAKNKNEKIFFESLLEKLVKKGILNMEQASDMLDFKINSDKDFYNNLGIFLNDLAPTNPEQTSSSSLEDQFK